MSVKSIWSLIPNRYHVSLLSCFATKESELKYVIFFCPYFITNSNLPPLNYLSTDVYLLYVMFKDMGLDVTCSVPAELNHMTMFFQHLFKWDEANVLIQTSLSMSY